MIPAIWYSPLASFLWQVVLHSFVMGLILYGWARSVKLPSGTAKQRLLGVLLVLPVVTAAIPGRATVEFAERVGQAHGLPLLDAADRRIARM